MLDPGENYANIGGMPAHQGSQRRGLFQTGGLLFRDCQPGLHRRPRILQCLEFPRRSGHSPAHDPLGQPTGRCQSGGCGLSGQGCRQRHRHHRACSPCATATPGTGPATRCPCGPSSKNTAANVGMPTNRPESPGTSSGTCRPTGRSTMRRLKSRLLAKDSRNLLGIHWITVPASGGQPAIQVSSAPITNPQLRDLWLWYLGTGLVNQTYATTGNGWLGTIWGKSGVYTGIKLATDYDHPYDFRTLPTPAGLVYAYEQMGAHPITPTELSRAQAGKYGFSSVTTDSIVKNLASDDQLPQGLGPQRFRPSLMAAVLGYPISRKSPPAATARFSFGRTARCGRWVTTTSANSATAPPPTAPDRSRSPPGCRGCHRRAAHDVRQDRWHPLGDGQQHPRPTG